MYYEGVYRFGTGTGRAHRPTPRTARPRPRAPTFHIGSTRTTSQSLDRTLNKLALRLLPSSSPREGFILQTCRAQAPMLSRYLGYRFKGLVDLATSKLGLGLSATQCVPCGSSSQNRSARLSPTAFGSRQRLLE